MTIDIITKYIHFLGIFGVFGSIFYEFKIVKSSLQREKIVQLAKVDGLYGICTIVVLFTGFALWLWVGKPADFYGSNWVFYSKIGVFSLIGIVSIYPTVFFVKNRKGNSEDMVKIPKIIKNLITIELLLMLIMPLLATTMARGIGTY